MTELMPRMWPYARSLLEFEKSRPWYQPSWGPTEMANLPNGAFGKACGRKNSNHFVAVILNLSYAEESPGETLKALMPNGAQANRNYFFG